MVNRCNRKNKINQGNLIMFPRTAALVVDENILSLIVESICASVGSENE